MKLNLGEKIKLLRIKEGRTQEELAAKLDVTPQAVSRWECGGAYPDMELIPAIANCFGITIDELFGYESDRDQKIDGILARLEAYGLGGRGDGVWIDECLNMLREGLAEFPGNERLLLALADTLSTAGWRRHGECMYYDGEGYIQHNYDKHKTNEYWLESVKICENLADHAADSTIAAKACTILVLLYRNFGEYDKAVEYANRMPELTNCRELLLAYATDGRDEAKYIGDALLKMASAFSNQCVYGLINNVHHYETDMPIEKIKGCIALFRLVCDDGNYGKYNGILIELHLYLSRIQWERGYHDEAFESLDMALYHARELEKVIAEGKCEYTAPLVELVKDTFERHEGDDNIARGLPDDWPMWCNPDYSKVEAEIKADPRWAEWVKRTQE